MIENKKIVITGGAGFIGSNLAARLAGSNEVTVLDNFSTGKLENLNGLDVNIEECSILDFNALLSLFSDVDCVFHLGALPSVPRSIRDPIQVHDSNATGTLNVLVAARDVGVGKVVYSSSSSAYGDTPTLPKVETMAVNPRSPYAISKLTGEFYSRVFYEIYGLPTAAVRYFNVYGPKQNPKSEYAAAIPLFIAKLMNNEEPTVYGDGEQTRDFTFVSDAVKGTILAAERKEANGEVINIAGGSSISINELIEKINTILGKDIEPAYTEAREGDVKHSLADISRAKGLLGYVPDYDIESGLRELIAYIESSDDGEWGQRTT